MEREAQKCDTCKIWTAYCDAEKPSCSCCLVRSVVCTYTSTTLRRKKGSVHTTLTHPTLTLLQLHHHQGPYHQRARSRIFIRANFHHHHYAIVVLHQDINPFLRGIRHQPFMLPYFSHPFLRCTLRPPGVLLVSTQKQNVHRNNRTSEFQRNQGHVNAARL